MAKKEKLSQTKPPPIKPPPIKPKETLTVQELQTLINLASNAQVKVTEAINVINIINKMGRMTQAK